MSPMARNDAYLRELYKAHAPSEVVVEETESAAVSRETSFQRFPSASADTTPFLNSKHALLPQHKQSSPEQHKSLKHYLDLDDSDYQESPPNKPKKSVRFQDKLAEELNMEDQKPNKKPVLLTFGLDSATDGGSLADIFKQRKISLANKLGDKPTKNIEKKSIKSPKGKSGKSKEELFQIRKQMMKSKSKSGIVEEKKIGNVGNGMRGAEADIHGDIESALHMDIHIPIDKKGIVDPNPALLERLATGKKKEVLFY